MIESTKSSSNKKYAITAVELLRKNKGSFDPIELWDMVLKSLTDEEKVHNSQMNVVLALWTAGMIS